MKIQLFCTALGICLSMAFAALTPSAQAQEATPKNGIVAPPATQKIIAVQGHYIAQSTPEQQAIYDQSGLLEHSAAIAFNAGNYVETESDARQALSLDPMSGVAEELIAKVLDAEGRESEALQAYRKMAEEGNPHPRNLLPYALLLLKAGQWEPAVDAYNKALPTLADGKLMRANSHFSASVHEPAALFVALHIALGLTDNGDCDWTGQYHDDKALEEYAKALQLAPSSGLANYYYGYGLQKLGRSAQANVAFQKTVKMAEGDVKVAAEQAIKK